MTSMLPVLMFVNENDYPQLSTKANLAPRSSLSTYYFTITLAQHLFFPPQKRKKEKTHPGHDAGSHHMVISR